MLLNPGISVLLAVAFFLLWRSRPGQVYVLLAALGHLATALGFFIQDVVPPWPFEFQRVVSNGTFLLAGSLLMSAVLGRYRLPMPWRSHLVIGGLGLGWLCWALFVHPDINFRILSISFALAAMALLTAFDLRRVGGPHLVDRLLTWACVFTGVNFLVRPITILLMEGGYSSYVGFQQSLYWTTVQFTQSLVSVLLALCLMIAIALDLISELQVEARTDKLSGLLNRRGFEDDANGLLAKRDGPLALILADLDHFKLINDRHGHVAGDAVIARFGRILLDLAPPGAVAGRIGGEEFALLVFADQQEALALAARLRQRMALPEAAGQPHTTVSIGVAAANTDDRLDSLLQQADKALYRAKRGGRDRVSLFRPGPAEPNASSAIAAAR